MNDDVLEIQLAEAQEKSRALQSELAETDHGLIALMLEHDEQLRMLHEELAQTNSELLQLTLELEDRVAQRVEELRLAEQKYQNIFENAVEGIFQATPDGRFLTANPALVRMLGYISEDDLKQRVTHIESQLYRIEDQGWALHRWLKKYGVVQAFETQLRCKDDSVIWVSINARAIYDAQGTFTHYDGTIEDITARKQAEEELRTLNAELEQRVNERTLELAATNKELEAFSYSVSHDLRAPLRTVDGFSRFLIDEYRDTLDDQGKHYLNRVREAARRMGQLIDDLLHLSRVTRSEMLRETVRLSQLAEDICGRIRDTEPDRAVEITIAPEIMVQGDKRLLQIALENLLRNAWKFTQKKDSPRIEFGIMEQDEKPVYYVRDNGAGFDMNYADKLFGTFQRLHKEEDFEGTGIGLATVQRIIHRHGGRVWAEGEIDQGATFYFTLS